MEFVIFEGFEKTKFRYQREAQKDQGAVSASSAFSIKSAIHLLVIQPKAIKNLV